MTEGNGNTFADKIDEIGENFAPKLDAIAGDSARSIVDILRRLPDSWVKLGEMLQESAITSCKGVARTMVRRSFLAMYADRQAAFEAALKDVSVGDKTVNVKFAIPRDAIAEDLVLELIRAKLRDQRITIAVGVGHYLGDGEPIKADKDEPELPLEGAAPDVAVTPPPAKLLSNNIAERETSELDPDAVGYAKGLEGAPESANPHPFATVAYERWRMAHDRGLQKRLGSSKQPFEPGPGDIKPPPNQVPPAEEAPADPPFDPSTGEMAPGFEMGQPSNTVEPPPPQARNRYRPRRRPAGEASSKG